MQVGTSRGDLDHRPLDLALKLVELVEASDVAVIATSKNGAVNIWSEGAEKLFGYPAAEIMGMSVSVLTPAELQADTRAILDRVMGGESVEVLETTRLAKDGSRLHVSLTVSSLRGPDGEVAGVLAIVRDLSDHARTALELSLSEERYRSVVESLAEGVLIRDAEGHVLAYNESAARILELPPGQLAAHPSYKLDQGFIRDDGSPVLDDELPTARTISTGVATSGTVMGFPISDGSFRWISVNSSPIRRDDSRGPGIAAVVSFTDITAQRQAMDELRASKQEILLRLALAAEYRDDDTYQHTARVAHSAQLLAGEVGLDKELVRMIGLAAPLHDVGKIGIPDSILLKPGKLTVEEFEQMKTHTEIGARILEGSVSPILRMGTEIALTHHERWDGTGYPAGLRAEEIPISGRITALADAFDAMTHARPYKPAYPVRDAVAEVKRASGTQFDPRLVGVFAALDHDRLV
jgi:putative two-component system response regulator